MKKLSFLLLCFMLLTGAEVSARVSYGEDVASQPDAYFSSNADAVDSLLILPPPPAYDSVLMQKDLAIYNYGMSLRGSDRAKQAASDADDKHLPALFSEAYGGNISQEQMPELYILLQRSQAELSKLSTRTAKDTYKRLRPYVLFKSETCYPEGEDALRATSSYPSGHSARGYGIALILSEINQGRKEIILRRGYEYGQSCVICGYNWQSDVDAGRIAAAAGVANLHANQEFQKQLAKAKAEFTRLAQQGLVKTN